MCEIIFYICKYIELNLILYVAPVGSAKQSGDRNVGASSVAPRFSISADLFGPLVRRNNSSLQTHRMHRGVDVVFDGKSPALRGFGFWGSNITKHFLNFRNICAL